MLELLETGTAAAGPLGFAAATAAMLLAGFLRGFAGFGAAMIVVPVLSIVYAPVVAVPIAFLSGLPAVLHMLPTAVRHAERQFIAPIAVAAFALTPLGTWALAIAPAGPMKVAVAIAVLAMVWFMRRGWRLEQRPGRWALASAGGVAGLIQGAAGIGGPPVVAMALASADDPVRQRANVIAAVTALSLATALPLWRLGLFTHEVLALSLLFVPAHTLAAWLGARWFERGGHRHYRQAALAILFAVGLITLAIALHGQFF